MLKILILFMLSAISSLGFNATLTSYCSAEDGNPYSCTGHRLKVGDAAADLHYYAIGDILIVGDKTYKIADCGRLIKGRAHFDIFTSSLHAMRKRGTIYADVQVIHKSAPKKVKLSACQKSKKSVHCLR